jgi:hypothetical protein
VPFVERSCGRIERDGCVPEVTHHLHLTGIIPDVCRNDAAETRGSPHLDHRFGVIGNEID